ncbi:AMP-binding protein [Reinekea marinisedimentorum]|nr:AMP-binding protein [Reinekea marinisedimentorum]
MLIEKRWEPANNNMKNTSLTTIEILKSAAQRYPDQEIVSALADESVHRYRYKDAFTRCNKLAIALKKLGIGKQANVGTLAANHYRHLEVMFAVSGVGAVYHPINAHLVRAQLQFIINHAENVCLFVDLAYLPQLELLADNIPSVKHIVVLCTAEQMPAESAFDLLCYETLIAYEPLCFEWPSLSQDSPSGLCYSSGTTGDPKGVIYENGSTAQHASVTGSSQFHGFDEWSVVMPVVPFYFINAWGVPYAAVFYGAKLVLPGCAIVPENVQGLIETEEVTHAYAVPDVWRRLHQYLQKSDLPIDSLQTIGAGGDPSPLELVKAYAQKYGVYWMGLWGMVETSPLVSAASRCPYIEQLPEDERFQKQASAGRAVLGIEIEIFDALGRALPHDGKTMGNIRIRGPWVAEGYFSEEPSENFVDGWFESGDVGMIDDHGYITLLDRSKDVIRSGGEWIVSVELEQAAMQYEAIDRVCVVGALHEKWHERPIMLLTLRPNMAFSEYRLRKVLQQQVNSWWMPDAILVVDELPVSGTGKLKKIEVRNEYRHYLLHK